MQRGLPGVSAEEEALPSERVLSGELLGERRREAFRGMREALGNHADGFTREEFSVAVSLLCPPHLPPGSVGARGSVAYRARECFPGLDGPAAVRAYCEHRDRPHVKALVADMRALEGLDVLAQRGMWRESQDLNRQVLMLKMRGPEEYTLEQNIAAMEPADVARLSLAMTAAMKATRGDFRGRQSGGAVWRLGQVGHVAGGLRRGVLAAEPLNHSLQFQPRLIPGEHRGDYDESLFFFEIYITPRKVWASSLWSATP